MLEQFGSNVGATGFGLRVDRLLEAMPRQTVENVTSLVLFEPQAYEQALKQAALLREQKRRVTMQSTVGLENVEAFKEQFQEVVYFSGQEEEV